MNTKLPAVSVIIPTFNREWCVRDAIQSVLDTRYPALEVIIIDDGSTDSTPKILEAIAATHPFQVKKFTHSDNKNHGIALSRNLGLKHASGKYISFLDSDDVYLPDRFKFSIPWLENNINFMAGIEPYLLAEYGNEDEANVKNHLIEIKRSKNREIEWLEAMLNQNVYWVMPVITMRREALGLTGLFDQKFPWAEETPIWLKLAASGVVGEIQSHTPTAMVRRHQKHSHGTDEIREWLIYMQILIDILRWTRRHQKIVSETSIKIIVKKLEQFTRELVANTSIPLKWKLSSVLRGSRYHPLLLKNPELMKNLLRSLKSALDKKSIANE